MNVEGQANLQPLGANMTITPNHPHLAFLQSSVSQRPVSHDYHPLLPTVDTACWGPVYCLSFAREGVKDSK